MYTRVNTKEPWHREGDVFIKISETRFSYGHVKLHENSDTLSIYWPQQKNLGVMEVTMNDEFNDIDFRNILLIDQRFSLGEHVNDKKGKIQGEVVGVNLTAVAHVYDSDYVIPEIPMELLTPESTLRRSKVLLNGWIGEVKDKFWTVAIQDDDNIKVFRDIRFPKRNLPSCAYPKTIIPIPGRKMQVGIKNKKYNIIDRKVETVRIEWYHRLKYYPHKSSEEPPPVLIGNPKMLKELVEIDINHFNECKKYILCKYTIREKDEFIPLKNWESIVFDNMLGLKCNCANCSVPKKKRNKDEFPHRVGESVLVNVLRTFSLLDVEWQALNGKTFKETIPSKDVIHQNRFKFPKIAPFRQFVRVKELYSNSSQTLGVIMCRKHTDKTALVQWLKKPGEKLNLVEESEFDLIPHEKFGILHIGQLVERSKRCHLKDFIVGVIRDIMSDGYVKIEVGTTEKKEVILTPDEFLICPSISRIGAARMKFDLRKKELNVGRNESDKDHRSADGEPSLSYKYLKAMERDKTLMAKYQLKPHLGISFQPVDYRDFCTAIIYGPEGTPYEDGLFMFEIHLPCSYPDEPPIIKMVTPFENSISFHFGRDGQIVRKVNDVLSSFPPPILWRADVTLEDLLLTIKNFVFIEEPYIHSYQDWDNGMTRFDIERIKIHRRDSLRSYNSNVVLEIFDSLLYLRSLDESRLHPVWRNTIVSHLKTAIPKVLNRLNHWMTAPNRISQSHPKFVLFPISRGLKESIKLRLQNNKKSRQP